MMGTGAVLWTYEINANQPTYTCRPTLPWEGVYYTIELENTYYSDNRRPPTVLPCIALAPWRSCRSWCLLQFSTRGCCAGCTVEPLTNDHPHQRPSLSYDHISCDGQWVMFVYESLTSDHPSYTTTPMWFWGWSYKRGSIVGLVCINIRHNA